MKLPARAHKLMLAQGFVYDYHHYMRYNGLSCDVVASHRHGDNLATHVMIGYPMLSGPIVSPAEFSLVRADRTFGEVGYGSESEQLWALKPSQILVDALDAVVMPHLVRMRAPEFLVALYTALMSDHSKLPQGFDKSHLRTGTFPARTFAFACCLALAGRFDEAQVQLAEVPERLRDEAHAHVSADCEKRQVNADPALLDYYRDLRSKLATTYA